jgi:hypothetical protein
VPRNVKGLKYYIVLYCTSLLKFSRLQLKCDGTRWRTGGEVKGKLANWVGGQYSSHYLATWCIQHYYRLCAHLGCSSRLNWRPRRFKWTRPFRRKTKSGFCACVITFQLISTYVKDLACVTSCAHLSTCLTRYVAFYGPKQVRVSRHNLYQLSSRQLLVTSSGNDLV